MVTGSKFSLEPSLDDASSLLNEGSRRSLAETSVTSTADLSVFSSATRSHAPDTHSAGDGDTGDESGGPDTPRASPDVVRIYVPYHSPTPPISPQNGEVPRPGDHNKIRIVVMDTPSPHEDSATPLAELGPPFKPFLLDQPTVDLKWPLHLLYAALLASLVFSQIHWCFLSFYINHIYLFCYRIYSISLYIHNHFPDFFTQ